MQILEMLAQGYNPIQPTTEEVSYESMLVECASIMGYTECVCEMVEYEIVTEGISTSILNKLKEIIKKVKDFIKKLLKDMMSRAIQRQNKTSEKWEDYYILRGSQRMHYNGPKFSDVLELTQKGQKYWSEEMTMIDKHAKEALDCVKEMISVFHNEAKMDPPQIGRMQDELIEKIEAMKSANDFDKKEVFEYRHELDKREPLEDYTLTQDDVNTIRKIFSISEENEKENKNKWVPLLMHSIEALEEAERKIDMAGKFLLEGENGKKRIISLITPYVTKCLNQYTLVSLGLSRFNKDIREDAYKISSYTYSCISKR